METDDDLILDTVKAVRGRHHKQPHKSSTYKDLIVSTETENYILKIGLTSYLKQTKLETKSFNDIPIEKLCFAQFIIKMGAWMLLTFFICLHNEVSSIDSIVT